MEKENRKHKDSLFVDLFYEDETAKKNLLSLYNALHDTEYQDEEMIHKVKVSDVLYKNFKNDISFEMGGKVLVFGEHQSTVNPNIPLRCLLYVGRAHKILDKCGILRGYSQFIDTVRKYSGEEDSIKKAINACINQGVLADYLKRKGSEVTNMLIAEYSYEEDIQVKQQEAMQKGMQNGMILSGKIFQAVKKNPDFTDSQIAEAVGCEAG